MGLTEKQRKFVEAYMGRANGNATEAARLAGYSGNQRTLISIGCENLTKPDIRKAIDARVDNCPLVADREELQRFFSSVLRGEVMDGEDVVKMKDRLRAAELLGKTRGEFRDGVDLTSGGEKIEGPVIYLPGRDEDE